MGITLNDEDRANAVNSVKEYAREHFDEPMGDLAAGFLIDFFLEEIAPSVYNQGVLDASRRAQAKLLDVEAELEEPTFTHWNGKR
ncbi:MAG: DUF2164 domain-containing protein [Rhodothermales bacterium]|nr:DUF2164 domain-containing protein [Rhodothermales bacterium]MBO6781181.1 DUF2164 domain-containing protein [Rhodothermales bacterium]